MILVMLSLPLSAEHAVPIELEEFVFEEAPSILRTRGVRIKHVGVDPNRLN